MDEGKSADSNKGRHRNRCACQNFPIKKLLRKKTSENITTPICACSSSYFLPGNHKHYCERLCQGKQVYLFKRSKDFCAQSKDNFFKMFPGFQFQCFKRLIIGVKDTLQVALLTCPKHGRFQLDDQSISSIKKNYQESTADILKIAMKGIHISDANSSKESTVQSSGVTLFGRMVCDTVKDLIKDVIVSDTTKIKNMPSDVEWITVESFLKELSFLTRSKDTSNTTINEVEIANELLSDTKMRLNAKESLINMLILPQSGCKADDSLSSMKNKLTKAINNLFVSKSYGDSPLISQSTSKESSDRLSSTSEDHSHGES